MSSTRKKRCKNGERYSRETKECEPFNRTTSNCLDDYRIRCRRGKRCNNGVCENTDHALRMRRCPRGEHRDLASKLCEPKSEFTRKSPRPRRPRQMSPKRRSSRGMSPIGMSPVSRRSSQNSPSLSRQFRSFEDDESPKRASRGSVSLQPYNSLIDEDPTMPVVMASPAPSKRSSSSQKKNSSAKRKSQEAAVKKDSDSDLNVFEMFQSSDKNKNKM